MSNALNIYDGPDENSMKIGEVFGKSSNKLLRSISSSGKTLFLDFKKQFIYHAEDTTEFEASIEYNKIMSICQTWLDVNKTILSFPDSSSKTNCSWQITSNFGSYIILNFEFIEVNSEINIIFVIISVSP